MGVLRTLAPDIKQCIQLFLYFEQFQIIVHNRIIDLLNSTSKTVDSLMKLDMPAGVDIEIRT